MSTFLRTLAVVIPFALLFGLPGGIQYLKLNHGVAIYEMIYEMLLTLRTVTECAAWSSFLVMLLLRRGFIAGLIGGAVGWGRCRRW